MLTLSHDSWLYGVIEAYSPDGLSLHLARRRGLLQRRICSIQLSVDRQTFEQHLETFVLASYCVVQYRFYDYALYKFTLTATFTLSRLIRC